jgi:hypothetical protein|tara:strand:- start:228 stop:515 length:288 start_codon:yes stop_codon:yes gene_type:complete
MERSTEPRQFELPLELQFSMRKAEMAAKDMTWDELYYSLLNLYHQRLMEWYAVKELLTSENIDLNFDVPTDLELEELAAACTFYENDDEDDVIPF